MDLSRSLYVAYIEEDDEQRSLFRVRPLLGTQGLVTQEDLDELGDDGYLRIVPDKSEQYTFKDRMRGLQPLCLIDTRAFGPELNKVRPNKNFGVKGEEHHQVLYSDCIAQLNAIQLFEVVADPGLFPPLTPGYYLRKGGHISGPYDRESAEPMDALSCIAPDSDRLFALSLPVGRDRLFYWPLDQVPLLAEPVVAAQSETTVPPVEEDNPRGFLEAAVHLEGALEQAGFALQPGEAAALLLSALTCREMTLTAHHVADAQIAADLLKKYAAGVRIAVVASASEDEGSLPRLALSTKRGFSMAPLESDSVPLEVKSVDHLAGEGRTPLSDQLRAQLEQAEEALAQAEQVLPLQMKHSLLRFLGPAQALLGAENALDQAFCSWLLPFCRRQGVDSQVLAPLCSALPRASRLV